MLFVGHTRFSLFEPNSRAWVSSQLDDSHNEDTYRDELFNEERLVPRVYMFFENSLAQIDRAIRGHEVYHIVSYSPELPDHYKARIEAACREYPWLVPDLQSERVPTITANTLVQNVLAERSGEAGKLIYGSYRLDDDDLLPTNYFDRMAVYTVPENVGMYVSLGLGATAIQHGEEFSVPRSIKQRFFTAGLLSVCRMSEGGRVERPAPYSGHSNADGAAPCIIDSRETGFFWNRHEHQDTSVGLRKKGSIVASKILRENLDRMPIVELNQEFFDLFPTLKDRVLSDGYDNHTSVREDSDTNSFSANFSYPANSFRAIIEMTAQQDVAKNNALFSLDIINETGSTTLTDDQIHILAVNGVHRSADRNIGFFAYLPTVYGTQTTERLISLPHGFKCSSVKLMPWGDTSKVHLVSLKIDII
ncbi:hypothetical protein FQ154_04780 [Paeniglutamicibacter gangotriensis]|uniref:Uncharacterized protein n=1 Tax=Paeniglutamicibacter gangotriensis TaxID=254787 RepID=A0A5B0EHP0_9MICC|nr:glycosyltransferase [Paeniglutamicibacter gangotriensis]KAA0978557.1 hypothetical protein FQ154_04780 [Paeniglutamicibacter gangotriensis]